MNRRTCTPLSGMPDSGGVEAAVRFGQPELETLVPDIMEPAEEPPSAGCPDPVPLHVSSARPTTLARKHSPKETVTPDVSLSRAEQFRAAFYPEATDAEWNDWRWQLRNRLRTADRPGARPEAVGRRARGAGPARPAPALGDHAVLREPDGRRPIANDPIRRSMIPVGQEWMRTPGEADDPLGEDASSPVHGLVHRYPDRVLFLVSDHCAVYCRYCTRSRVVGSGEMTVDVNRWNAALDYLRATPAVRDVLLSGGDPLTLSDAQARAPALAAARDPAHRVPAHRHQGAGRACPSGSRRSWSRCSAATASG